MNSDKKIFVIVGFFFLIVVNKAIMSQCEFSLKLHLLRF